MSARSESSAVKILVCRWLNEGCRSLDESQAYRRAGLRFGLGVGAGVGVGAGIAPQLQLARSDVLAGSATPPYSYFPSESSA